VCDRLRAENALKDLPRLLPRFGNRVVRRLADGVPDLLAAPIADNH
jgi:hypothetical protein